MKKLFISIGFLLSLVAAFGQPITPRGSSTNTVADQRLQATLNFFTPRYADTTAANAAIGIDSCGAVIFTYDAMSFWGRKCSPKRWEQLGGTVSTTNTSSITFSGNGATDNPLAATLNISTAAGNALQLNPDGLFSPLFLQDGLKLGGNISNVGGIYTYDVQTAFYVINGVGYTAPTTQVTLSNSDPTFDRIDRIVATTSGTIIVLEGVAQDNPQEPSYDPTTQLPLGIVLVTAGSSGPTVTNEQIYINNAEWTTSSSTIRINPASAVNPFSAPLDVQFTAAQNGDNISFTDPSPPTNLNNYKILTLKIISDAAWASTSRLILQFRSGTTNVGLPVSIFDGALFNSSQTSTYQTFTTAITNFAPTGTVTNLLITVSTTGANTISAKIDDIVLQGGDGAIVPVQGTFHQQGGNRYASTFVVGSQDNFNTNVIANNATIATFQTGGTMWMPQTNPGISFFLGTFAAADYYIRRVSNTVTLNVASGAIIDHTISGNSMYNISAANGHLFNSSAAAFQMQLNASGQLLVGTNSQTSSNLAAFNSTTRAVRLTNQTTAQMNAIANDAGMITYNTTAGSLYYNNGAGWFPIGGAVTADNGVNMSSASNVQWGGALTTNATTTITGDNGNEKIVFAGAPTSGVWFTATSSTGAHAIEGVNTSTGNGVQGTATSNGNGVYGLAVSGVGTGGYSESGAPGQFQRNTAVTSSTVTILDLQARLSSGTVGANFAGSIDFTLETDANFQRLNNQIIATWSDNNDASRTSQLRFDGINSTASNTIATFDGSGVVGIGVTTSFVGSRLDVRDDTFTSGTMANFSTSSSNYASSNDGVILLNITGTTSGSIQTYGLEVIHSRTNSGANIGIISTVSNGSSGSRGVYGNAGTSGVGVYGRGSLGVVGEGTTSGGAAGEFFNDNGGEGIRVSSTDGLALQVNAQTSASPGALTPIVHYTRNDSGGTPSNGIGLMFEYTIETSTSNDEAMIESIYWSDATHVSRTSRYDMKLVDNTNEASVLTIEGSGQITLGADYQGLGVGYLSVDNSGVVTWSAGSGGGGGDVVKVGTPVDNQLGVWTGNGTIEGDANLTFTGSTLTVGLAGTATGVLNLTGATSGTISIQGASASGTYTITLPTTDGNSGEFLQTNGSGVLTWATPAGAGTVTSVGLSSSDITVGGSASPITTTGAWTLTLATVNSNVGSFGSSSAIPVLTVNAKGLVTAATTTSITAPAGALTGTTLAANVVTSSLTSHGTITSGGLGAGAVIGDVTMNLSGTDATGDIYIRNASGVLTRVPIGSAGQVLVVNPTATGLQYSTLASGGTVTSVTLTQPAAGGFTITNSGAPQTTIANFAFSLTGDLAGIEALATLGIVRRTAANVYSAGTLVSLSSEVTGTLPVANGGTNINSITSSRLLVTNGTGYVQDLPTFGNGIIVTMTPGHIDIRGVFNPTVQSLTDAATVIWNVTNGGNATLLLIGTGRTLTIQNPVAGYTYTIRIIQNSANRTISTWPTGTRWAGGTPPTLSTTAGAMDVVSLYYDGSNFYGTFGAAFSMIDIPMIEEGKVIPLYLDDIKHEETIEIAA